MSQDIAVFIGEYNRELRPLSQVKKQRTNQTSKVIEHQFKGKNKIKTTLTEK